MFHKLLYLLIAFIAFFLTTHYSLLTTVFSHSAVQVIKMTPLAFDPAEIFIDENSTIIFVNQDTVGRWPASNLHPTHELYPEFDPKHEIQPSESWSFKPKNPGVWKYHDHSNPHLQGTIAVTKEAAEQTSTSVFPAEIIESAKAWFATLVNKVSSFFAPGIETSTKPEEFKKLAPEEQFRTLIRHGKSQGGEAAWNFITQTYQSEAGGAGNIHDLAHLSGKLIYEDKGIAGISACSPTFAFGCYHGLLDAAFQTSLDDMDKAAAECAKVGAVNSGPYGSCVHGIGHGVASFYKSKDLKGALASCSKLPAGHDFCFDGVFMEFVRSATPSFYTKDKPFSPCDTLEKEYGDRYSLPCGRNQPSVFVSRFGMEFSDAVRLCGTNVLHEKFKTSCFDALGFMLASTQEPAKIIAGCKGIDTPLYQSLCLKSAAGELVFQNIPSWPEKSKEVCNASPQPAIAMCHDNLQRIIKEYGRDKN